MLQLFFGGFWPTVSTLFLLLVVFYMVYTTAKHRDVTRWGRRILILGLSGLLLCVAVVMRDDYAAAVQGGAGVFPINSLQIYFAYALAAVIGFSALSSIFVRSQAYRKRMFFILSIAILIKALIIEVSRFVIGSV